MSTHRDDGPTGDIVLEFNGRKAAFSLPQRDSDHVQKSLMSGGKFYEHEMLAHAASVLRPGDLVIDIGAYIGTHTVFYGAICEARVIAFEPNPKSRAILERNVALNRLEERVTIFPFGIGQHPSRATVVTPGTSNQGMASLSLDEAGPVEVRRLDDVELPAPPRVIKIDVEGMELEVLEGALETIRRHRPILYVECATYRSFTRSRRVLDELGYAASVHFNATATILFVHGQDGAGVLNDQLSYLQYALDERFRAVHESLRTLTATTQREAKAADAARHERTPEVRAALDGVSRIEAALDQMTARIDDLAAQQVRVRRALDGLRQPQDLRDGQWFDDTLRKYRKLRRDPVQFIRDSRVLALGARLGVDATPRSPLQRKAHKLATNPQAFFRDAKNPLVQRLGLRAVERVSAIADARRGKVDASSFDAPARSVIALARPEPELIKSLARISATFGHETELVLLLERDSAERAPEIVGAMSCPRVRAYVFEDVPTIRELFAYGLARAVGDHVVVLGEPQRVDARDVRAVLQRLPGDATGIVEPRRAFGRRAAPALVGLRADAAKSALVAGLPDAVLRLVEGLPRARPSERPIRFFAYTRALQSRLLDQLSMAAEEDVACVVLGVGVEQLRAAMTSATSEQARERTRLVDADAAGPCHVYRAPALDEPFGASWERASVICIERAPAWVTAVADQLAGARPKISVVMTMYNAAATVERAIDSVLEQSYGNLELIIVDDCSTDDSVGVATRRTRHDPRIKIVQTPRNSGTYFAKNLGITHATGTFVTFQDADDFSVGNRLELQLAALLARPDSLGNVVVYQRLAGSGQLVLIGNHKNRLARISLMLRRQPFLARFGGFDSVRVSADDELLGRMRAAGEKILKLPHVAYFALHGQASLTTSGETAILTTDGTFHPSALRDEYHRAAVAWHERISAGAESPKLAFPPRRRPFPAPARLTPDREEAPDETVTASMATMPSRIKVLEKTIASILPQVDRLDVYLNNFTDVPKFLVDPKITLARSQDHGDRKDNGKFFFVGQLAPGYHFTIDDDIEYPPDYVTRTILAIERYQRRAVIGVHGVDLADPLVAYTRNRRVLHFKEALRSDQFVQLLGTGTTAYHTSTLRVAPEAFETTGAADLWFAIQARQQGVPLVAQARPAQWLVPLDDEHARTDSLHARARRNDQSETAIAQAHGPWTADAMTTIRAPLARALVQPCDARRLRGLGAQGCDVHALAAGAGVPPVRFSLIVPGWNCADRVAACWESIATQHPGHYTYDAYLIDDGSTDGTGDALRALPQAPHVKVVHHRDNHGPAYSRFWALQQITEPDRVCVLLDLDDALLPGALARLAEAYLTDPDCWLTAGNWGKNPLEFYDEDVLRRRAYRDIPQFKVAPVRSFRRFLADRLEPSMFLDEQGRWLMMCTDVALMFPLIEQCAPENIRYIHDPLYVYSERRDAGTLARFGKPRKVETYRRICAMPRAERYQPRVGSSPQPQRG